MIGFYLYRAVKFTHLLNVEFLWTPNERGLEVALEWHLDFLPLQGQEVLTKGDFVLLGQRCLLNRYKHTLRALNTILVMDKL